MGFGTPEGIANAIPSGSFRFGCLYAAAVFRFVLFPCCAFNDVVRKSKQSIHRGNSVMAWGYESSFIVEHDQTLRKNINCKDCVYYETDDKTCRKRPLYLPHDGYNSWKHCKYFELDQGAINYLDKKEKYASVLRRKEVVRNQEKKAKNKQVASTKDTHDPVRQTPSKRKT